MWGQPGRARRGVGGARNGQNAALLLMLLQRINNLDRKPPLTLALMGLMYALHFQKTRAPYLFRPYSLCPDKIVHDHDVARLFALALLHVDDWHLYHNMASFLWKGYHLEHKLGSARFAVATCYLLVLSQVLVVAVSFALTRLAHVHEPFYQCSIGFSGVLFALKVLLNHNSPAFTSVYGFQVPTKYAAWLELVVIHFLVPRSSFMGHMCGILAGYIYVLSPGLQRSAANLVSLLVRFIRKLMPPAPLQDQSPHPSSNRASPSGSSSTPVYENDEMLARRLQEQEYRRAEQSGSSAASFRESTPDFQQHMTQDELRRRRIDRLNQQQR
ncbi:Serine protease family [Globisporangium polare]